MLRAAISVAMLAALTLSAASPALATPPDQAPLGPSNSPLAAIATVNCGGEEVTVAVMVPQAGPGSAKEGRPGVGHVEGSTAKQVPFGIRAVGFGAFEGFFDEFHWGNSDLEEVECSFTIPLPGGGINVTVFVMVTPQAP